MKTPLLAAMVLASATLFAPSAFAQQLALVPSTPECPSVEPDSVQISWDTPCEEGNWLFDTQVGCRMWDWHPEPKDRAVWSGSCPRGLKEGRGAIQWFEHGQPVDRFEGAYRDNKREGFGRYVWNETDRFEGRYENDVPNGFGTATLAGQTFSGNWKKGCMRVGNRVVAIGVPRKTCEGVPTAGISRPQSSAF